MPKYKRRFNESKLSQIKMRDVDMNYQSLHTGHFLMVLSSADFFSNLSFSKYSFRNTRSECHTVWIQIGTDILSVLICAQTACKGYQQMTKFATSRERINGSDSVSTCWPVNAVLVILRFDQ